MIGRIGRWLWMINYTQPSIEEVESAISNLKNGECEIEVFGNV